MTIKQMAAKFRHAAEVLEDLAGIDRPTLNETPGTARKLRKAMKKKRAHHKGPHWTQKPENQGKLKKMHKKATETRQMKSAAA